MHKTFILGVGSQKCGTTWLHRYLKQSDIFDGGMAKEYHIWDALDIPLLKKNLVPRPSVIKGIVRPKSKLRHRMQTDNSFYFEYFDSLYNSKIRLSSDITPSYSGLGAKRLRFLRQGFEQRGITCKAVSLIRNPISRIKSAVRSNLDKRNYKEGIDVGETNFVNALRQYYKSEHCEIRTNYHQTIQQIFESFEPEDIYIGFYENMFEDTEIEKLSRFLGIPPKVNFSSVRVNKTKSKTTSDEALESEIISFYKNVYDYCYEKFPITRTLWS